MNIEPVEFTLQSHIACIDWIIIALFILITIAISIYYSKRSQKSVSDYFASGQGVPWWILGTSMVATTFAADTPLAMNLKNRCVSIVTTCVVLVGVQNLSGQDWPQWRGLDRRSELVLNELPKCIDYSMPSLLNIERKNFFRSAISFCAI